MSLRLTPNDENILLMTGHYFHSEASSLAKQHGIVTGVWTTNDPKKSERREKKSFRDFWFFRQFRGPNRCVA
jgi:hypothetical protein